MSAGAVTIIVNATELRKEKEEIIRQRRIERDALRRLRVLERLNARRF